jgi:hypothetical protein
MPRLQAQLPNQASMMKALDQQARARAARRGSIHRGGKPAIRVDEDGH